MAIHSNIGTGESQGQELQQGIVLGSTEEIWHPHLVNMEIERCS